MTKLESFLMKNRSFIAELSEALADADLYDKQCLFSCHWGQLTMVLKPNKLVGTGLGKFEHVDEFAKLIRPPILTEKEIDTKLTKIARDLRLDPELIFKTKEEMEAAKLDRINKISGSEFENWRGE